MPVTTTTLGPTPIPPQPHEFWNNRGANAFFNPSGLALSVSTGAFLYQATSTGESRTPPINPELFDDGLVGRWFGWDDPFYVRGSDIHPSFHISDGSKYGNNIETGRFCFSSMVDIEGKQTGVWPRKGSRLILTGVYQNYQDNTSEGDIPGQGDTSDQFDWPSTPQAVNTFDPINSFTDLNGFTKKALYISGGANGAYVSFPHFSLNNNQGYFEDTDGYLDFFTGTENGGSTDSAHSPAYGFTLMGWMVPAWGTNCWGDMGNCDTNNCAPDGEIPGGPGCEVDWTTADDAGDIKCIGGATLPGDCRYVPFSFGNSIYRCVNFQYNWYGGESSHRPATLGGDSTRYCYTDTADNPPAPWDGLYNSGQWSFFAITYDGKQIAPGGGNTEAYALSVSIGMPTGGGGDPSLGARGDNFFYYSGDGTADVNGIGGVGDLKVNSANMGDLGSVSKPEFIGKGFSTTNFMFQIGGRMLADGRQFPQSDGSNWRGRRTPTKQEAFPGYYSDLRVYNRPLNTGEIFSVYNGTGRV